MARPRFDAEADMIPPILAARRSIAGPDDRWTWICELGADHGVADVALIRFIPENLAWRGQAGIAPITQRADMAVILALQRGPLELGALAARVNQTARHLRRCTLSLLVERGFVEEAGSMVGMSAPYVPVADRIIAIEAKRRDWPSALDQARRYRSFADRVFVAIEADVAARLGQSADLMRQQRIGLVSVDPGDNRARVVLSPRRARALSGVSFALAAERAWASLSHGQSVHRTTAHVFGRQGLIASAGLPTRRDEWAGYLPLAA